MNDKLIDELTVGEPDCGGNRPLDYTPLEAHSAAEVTLREKNKWDELTQDEIAVLRDKASQLELAKDVVFRDRLNLLRCLFFHCESRDEWRTLHKCLLDEVAKYRSEDLTFPSVRVNRINLAAAWDKVAPGHDASKTSQAFQDFCRELGV